MDELETATFYGVATRRQLGKVGHGHITLQDQWANLPKIFKIID